MGFAEVILWAVEKGIFQFFLPFALVFLITYAIVLKLKLFGDKTELLGGILSFFIALFVMLYGLNVYIEQFLAWTLGRGGLFLILILFGLIVYGFSKMGGESS